MAFTPRCCHARAIGVCVSAASDLRASIRDKASHNLGDLANGPIYRSLLRGVANVNTLYCLFIGVTYCNNRRLRFRLGTFTILANTALTRSPEIPRFFPIRKPGYIADRDTKMIANDPAGLRDHDARRHADPFARLSSAEGAFECLGNLGLHLYGWRRKNSTGAAKTAFRYPPRQAPRNAATDPYPSACTRCLSHDPRPGDITAVGGPPYTPGSAPACSRIAR